MKKIIYLLFMAFLSCQQNKIPAVNRNRIVTTFREAIENTLRFPGNAQFTNYDIAPLGDSIYLIIVDVDAANGFGARSRVHYAGKIAYTQDGAYVSRIVMEDVSNRF